MHSWLNSLMVAYIARRDVRRDVRGHPRKVVGGSKVSPLASLRDAIIFSFPTVISRRAFKRAVRSFATSSTRFLRRLLLRRDLRTFFDAQEF